VPEGGTLSRGMATLSLASFVIPKLDKENETPNLIDMKKLTESFKIPK